jgi:hypothetical protein
MKYRVYFDYEVEDAVVVDARSEYAAVEEVAKQLKKVHDWDSIEDALESMNADLLCSECEAKLTGEEGMDVCLFCQEVA